MWAAKCDGLTPGVAVVCDLSNPWGVAKGQETG